jgi:hypothetical protein
LAEAPPPRQSEADAHRGGRNDLHHGSGQGDGAHAHQILEREVQTDPEHQQDHTNLCQLTG